MRSISKHFILFFSLISASVLAGNGTGTKPGPGGANDTTVSIKSNIVIFKMISSPQTTAPAVSGTLKKAGKVARTSNSSTSLILPLLPPKRNL